VVRNLTYALFAELGRAPSAEEIGQAAGLSGGAHQPMACRSQPRSQTILDQLHLNDVFWRLG
jgi:hypothetical protein